MLYFTSTSCAYMYSVDKWAVKKLLDRGNTNNVNTRSSSLAQG